MGPPPHCKCHCNSQLPRTIGGWVGRSLLQISTPTSTASGQWGWWVLLHITHVTSTLNCQWPVGMDESFCTSHMSLQLSIANGQWGGVLWVLLHIHTCHFNSQLPVANGGPPPHCKCHFNSQQPMADGVGWVLLHITHVTSTLNCQWPMGVVGSSSTSHISLQLSTANGQWGVGRSSSTLYMSLQLSMASGGGILHISHPKSHFLGVGVSSTSHQTELNVSQQ